MFKCVVLSGYLLSSVLWAADAPIGWVKNVTGDASVSSHGVLVRAESGTAVWQGSVLRTGAKSSMGITFKDETIMSFGPNTQMSVDEYLYAPAQGQLSLVGKLAKGTMNYVSGIIAKLQPDAVAVNTPVGMIGVRGTQFVVKVEE
ncbi:FecR family protein [Iodobacter fluviatilis]|uniref:FecR protein domain-containing protein n=1 Tax=Iodobacter fluviatilis TaxID=537 RepID=A0A7G3G5T5_9NEIS|nr:FecR domain-containing protein [Iodobacter fluviatilis]QBC42478.1 hypothetical protein C1H71_02170 [Iodobacter fluviatilis]